MSAKSCILAATGGSTLDPCAIRRNAISSSEERGVSVDFIAPSVTFNVSGSAGHLISAAVSQPLAPECFGQRCDSLLRMETDDHRGEGWVRMGQREKGCLPQP